MGGGEGKGDVLMQSEQLFKKNMLKYETDQLITQPRPFFAKSTDYTLKGHGHDYSQNIFTRF